MGGHHRSALQAASADDHQGIVWLPLEKGADANIQGEQCPTVLQATSVQWNDEDIRLLLEKVANVKQ